MQEDGRLAPSIRSKVEGHLRERDFVESILPVSRWKVELASFDIHKITNPDVASTGYQEGVQKGYYNTKAYVLDRDHYTCQSGRKCKHSDKLHVHHVIFRSDGGSDLPANLKTLCATCHDDLHAGKFTLKADRSKTKHATEVGIIKRVISALGWLFAATFGYETKWKREQCLGWPKSHANDAVAICCEDGEVVTPSPTVYRKRHVSKGDYQQTSGPRGEKRIPTGKLFGLKKFDKVNTPKGVGFVKGKRSSGYFAIATIDGTPIHNSARAVTCVRLAARSTTLTTRNG
jgi:5-methylcytosine-specific restriction endonuclease McrA